MQLHSLEQSSQTARTLRDTFLIMETKKRDSAVDSGGLFFVSSGVVVVAGTGGDGDVDIKAGSGPTGFRRRRSGSSVCCGWGGVARMGGEECRNVGFLPK